MSLVLLLLGCGLLVLPGRCRPADRPTPSHPGRLRLGRLRQGPLRFGSGTGSGAVAATALLVTAAAFLLVGPGRGPVGLLAAPAAGSVSGWALHRLRRRQIADGSGVHDPTLPLVLDLTAAALRSGRPVADAVRLAAPAGGSGLAEALDRVAALLRLGADPVQAWSGLAREGPLGEVAAVAVRSAASGIRLAASFERLAAEVRAERGVRAASRAQRAGVVVLAPLAGCFLPSFVCLGVIPVVVGVARSALAGLP